MDDCGKRINPLVVEGQVHGATGLGIAAALYESLDYDEAGQLQEPSFYEYHVGTSLDIPYVATGSIESPSPFTPNGAKGMGEGGGAPLHAVCSAIQDALGADGPIVTESHNHWARVYELLHRAPGAQRGIELVSRSGGPDVGETSL